MAPYYQQTLVLHAPSSFSRPTAHQQPCSTSYMCHAAEIEKGEGMLQEESMFQALGMKSLS